MQSVFPLKEFSLPLSLLGICFALLMGCSDGASPTAADERDVQGDLGLGDLGSTGGTTGDADHTDGGITDSVSDGGVDGNQGIAVGEPNPNAPLVNTGDFVEQLRARGLDVVDDGERIASDFLPEARVVHFNGEPVNIYEFDSVEALKDVAGEISADGYTIGRTQLMWISSPHFFARGNLLGLYVGVEESTLRLLLNILGSPIAGAELNIPVDDGSSTTPGSDDGFGALGEPQLLVIDDEQQLSMVLDWIQDDELADRLQDVNLDREWIVFVARGQMPTAGYEITIEHVSLNEEGVVVVEVSLTNPPIDAFVAQVITYPIDVSTISRDAVPSPSVAHWIAAADEGFRVGQSHLLGEPMPLPDTEQPVDDMLVDPVDTDGTHDSLPPDAVSSDPGVISDPLPVHVDIRGKITQLDLFDDVTTSGVMARLLIEAETGDDTGYDRAWVEITSATQILRLMADTQVQATMSELTAAASVVVHFTGPVRESYPVQAVAGQILILP